MHPLLFDSKKLIGYIIAWLLIGLLIARFITLAGLSDWSAALLFAMPVCLIYGFIASSAYYVCRALPITGRRIVPTTLYFCSASLFSGAIWLALCIGWNSLAESMSWWSIPLSKYSNSLLFFAGCGCYLFSLLLHDLLIAAERVRAAELKEAKSLVLARESELQMLRAQINPHFLFNSLNSISALTSIDGAAARKMTIALANFFRLSLAHSGQQDIPLKDEIALCEEFLKVEKTRFGEKLNHIFTVEPDVLECNIPPMLLQPLLENAVKHGVRSMAVGGTVQMRCFRRDAWLYIMIENPFEPSNTDQSGTGIGLENIRQRLSNLYSNQARIQWARNEGRFSVELTLPITMP